MAFATVVVPYNNFASGISFSDSPNPDTSTCFDEKANDIYVFVSRPLDCKGASPDPESLADTLEKSLGLNNHKAGIFDGSNDEFSYKLIITKPRPKISD